MKRTVHVPESYRPLFERAEELVAGYFADRSEAPERGCIEISGERYILVRAASMSVEFFDLVESLHQEKGESEAFEIARNLLFDVAHAMGMADAAAFAERMKLESPEERLSAGPAHFAHAGWASVRIHDEGAPGPGADYLLIYDHPYSFESEAWVRSSKRPPGPICIMNAGYSSGWCESSFGFPLVSTEITCKALGHEQCRFVMAPPSRIDERVSAYLRDHRELDVGQISGLVPGFLERQIAEDELREREAQYRGVFEAVTDALLVIEPDGCVVQSNPSAQLLLSISDIAAGVHVDELLDLGSGFADVADRVRDKGHYTSRAVLGAEGAEDRHVEVHASPIVHRGRDRMLVVIHDTTETERAQRELRAANEALEARREELRETNQLLTEINADLFRARDQAVAANRAKSEFIARMSHEFRTPLNAVIGYAELIQEEIQETGEAPRAGDVGNIITAATHLLELINEVLDMAKIEAGEVSVSVETFDLQSFMEDIVEVIRPAIRENRNTLRTEIRSDALRVCADKLKLRQIMLNLLSNAAKFTRDGEVTMDAETYLHGGETMLRFVVSDTGIGMSEDTRAVLFSPFRQADESTTRRYGGTGLGLAISQAFARLMGGDIEVESKLGVGSTFRLVVPVWVLETSAR